MKQNIIKILFAAGGTGGHLFPALAVADEIRQKTNGSAIIEFVGTADKLESTIVPQNHYRLHTIPIHGLQKLASLQTLRLPFEIIRSLWICHSLIRRFQPDIVVCAGAYLSYPVGLAAIQRKIPLFLMESNAIPGKTITRLASGAERIFTSFPQSVEYFPESLRRRIEAVGNPVRAAFKHLPPQAESRRLWGLSEHKPTVLFFGGSLGALSINRACERHREHFAEAGIQMLWQTGKNFTPARPSDNNTVIVPFITDMAAAYSAADLVVCRAGATTIAELARIAKPAILVPFSRAANNHQTHNARTLERQGAAQMLTDDTVEECLFDAVQFLLQTPEILSTMQEKIKQFASPEAAANIAGIMLEYINREQNTWKK